MKLRTEQVTWQDSRALLATIRVEVFVHEQGVPIDEEWDALDEVSRHWLVYEPEQKTIATARLTPNGQIGRMAVLAAHRSKGVGFDLLQVVVNEARLHFDQVYLHAQSHAIGFYQRAGFVAHGPEFEEAGIMHQKMLLVF
ncbi:MAG: GNAT family N-acetyltransferase [Pseudomonadales bacterium]|nr:GNAT family N-acetyltransferase [Pseudomonadales bacterium]